ncbi:MAG: site-specific integrase [Clostridiaceae bacterium]|nr:site-specific integrase [Clostridiaceae bacterium]
MKKSTKSVQRYQAIVNSFIQYLEEKGKERYSDITERDITEFIDLLINQNRSTSTLSKYPDPVNKNETFFIFS